MSYDDYKTARDMAWKILLECGIDALPVRPSVICDHYGWVLADYHTGASSIALLGLEELTKQTDGFCAVTKSHAYIFSSTAHFRQGGNGSPSHTWLGTWYLVTSHQAASRRSTESLPQGTTLLNARQTSLRRGCWRPPASCTSWEPSHRRPSSGLVDSRARPLSSVRPGCGSWSAATATIPVRWNGRYSNNLHHISPVYLGGNTASSSSFDT